MRTRTVLGTKVMVLALSFLLHQALYNNQALEKGSGSKDKTHLANPKE